MAIQNRRGAYVDFDPTKMVAGEFAVVQSGDENTDDGKALYVAPTTGSVKRIPFADELEGLVEVDDTLTEAGAAADAKKTGDEITALKDDLDNIVPGLSEEAKAALLSCFEHVAWIGDDGQDYYDALETALAGTPETYSTVLFNDGTLIINERGSKRSANIEEHGAVISEYPPLDETHSYSFTVNTSDFSSTAYWYADRANITQVKIGSRIKPTRLQGWFCGLLNCTTINLTNLDASNVTNARYMFAKCNSLVNINTNRLVFSSKLTDALGIFRECASIERLDLSAWDFSRVYTVTDFLNGCASLQSVVMPDLSRSIVTDIDLSGTQFVFKGCESLVSVDLSKFNTSKTNNLRGFFHGCSRLVEIDISSFSAEQITNTTDMFNGCSLLRTIYASTNFNTSINTSSSNMFAGCTNLVGGSGTTYNANVVDKTRARIDGGTSSPGYFTAV